MTDYLGVSWIKLFSFSGISASGGRVNNPPEELDSERGYIEQYPRQDANRDFA